MKKFKYNFTPLIWILLITGIAIAILTSVLNIVYIIDATNKDIPINASRIIAILVAFIFMAFIIVVIANSSYEITNLELKTKLGFITSGYKLKDIKEIVLFTKSKRLSLIFKDEEFTNIVIKQMQYDDFIKTLKQKAPHIIYTPYEEE